jgi:hypothetical protein
MADKRCSDSGNRVGLRSPVPRGRAAKHFYMSRPQPDTIASGYSFLDRIVLHSLGQTPAGFYIACEPYVTLPREAPPEDIGRAVQTVLYGYQAEVPQPVDWKQFTAVFVRGLGAKSHKKVQESSMSCGISQRQGRLEFNPTHNGGTSGDGKGFQPIAGAHFSIPASAAPSEIGEALLRGFGLCTTIYL